jgi:hypothetical protein
MDDLIIKSKKSWLARVRYYNLQDDDDVLCVQLIVKAEV